MTALTATLALAAAGLAACSPPRAAETPRPPVAALPPPKAPAPPARLAHMICRSSLDGRKLACGAPNAVMVGMKYD